MRANYQEAMSRLANKPRTVVEVTVDNCDEREELFEWLLARVLYLSAARSESKKELLYCELVSAANRDLAETCKVMARFVIEAAGRKWLGGGADELTRITRKVTELNAGRFAREVAELLELQGTRRAGRAGQ